MYHARHEVRSRRSRLRLLAAALAISLAGCGGADAPTVEPPAPLPTANRVEVTAPETSVALGDPLQLSAAVFIRGVGRDTSARPVWSLADSSRARVDSRGVVTGFATGVVDVTANWFGTIGTFRVTLTPATGAWGIGYVYGGTNNDGGDNIIGDAAGNLYVAGGTAGTVDGQSTGFLYGDADALVTRMLPNGKKAWTKLVNTRTPNTANGLALHKDGGVVVLSSSLSGSYITYVNASGRTVWETYLLASAFTDVVSDRAGNFYVTGVALRQNGATVCPGVPQPAPNGSQQGGDGLLLKFGPDGRQLWCRLWTHVPSGQRGAPIPVFSTNGISIGIDEARGALFVGGVMQFSSLFALTPFLHRFNLADGSSDWNRFINPRSLSTEPTGRLVTPPIVGTGVLHGVAVDRDGSVWAAVSEDSLGSPADVGHFTYVVKVGPTGAEQLRRTVEVPRTTPAVKFSRSVNAIAYRASANDIIMVASYGGQLFGRANYPNGTVLAFDVNGNQKWQQLLANPQPPINPTLSFRAITSLPNGDIFVVGDTDFGAPPGYADDTPAGLLGTSLDIIVARIAGRP